MSWAEAFENINYVAVLLGLLASMVLGATWYAEPLWGGRWMKQVGLKKKDLETKEGMAVMFVQSTVFYALVSLFIAALFEMIAAEGVGEGLLLGFVVGFVFSFGPLAVTYGFARRKYELTLIDGGYMVVTCLAIGGIVGAIG